LINLNPTLVSYSRGSKDPLIRIIQKNEKIVVAGVAELTQGKAILPLDDRYIELENLPSTDGKKKGTIRLTKDRTKKEGFSEFDLNFYQSTVLEEWQNSLNPVRYPYLPQRKFHSKVSSTNPDYFLSATCLLIKISLMDSPLKDCQVSPDIKNRSKHWWSQDSVQIDFWGNKNQFSTIPIDTLCDPNTKHCDRGSNLQELKEKVEGQVVLIGFNGGEPSTSSLPSPFSTLSPVEMQANLMASLIGKSFYDVVRFEVSLGITLFGLVLVSGLLALGGTKSKVWYVGWGVLIILGLTTGYFGLFLLAFQNKIVLPLILPIGTWVATGVSVALSLICWRYQDQVTQQKHTLMNREAVLRQTRKLLSRVATDIHDGPLQELKLVMDQIEEIEPMLPPETLKIKHSTFDTETIPSRLAYIGNSIRDGLSELQIIAASQGNISSELSLGLVKGIQRRIEHLTERGKLRLEVVQDLETFKEPRLDSGWIDTREDVFRFFKEAINNVICHAQPPYGSATQLRIALNQIGPKCTLVVENDGLPPVISTNVATSVNQQLNRGAGTKMMETMTAEIPDGEWERIFLTEGGVRVKLSWTSPSDKI